MKKTRGAGGKSPEEGGICDCTSRVKPRNLCKLSRT